MTVFDEIKQKMHEAIDKAVDALHGEHDLEAARPVAQATTEALKAQALQVEANLIKHVTDNAAAVPAPTAEGDGSPAGTGDTETATSETPTETGAPAADAKTKTTKAK